VKKGEEQVYRGTPRVTTRKSHELA